LAQHTVSTRRAQTKLMVRDGGTSVIAGIYQVKGNDSQARLPSFIRSIIGAYSASGTTTPNMMSC